MNENVNTNEVKNEQPQGWASVLIDEQTPIGAIFDFINILNQRICRIENIVQVDVDGKGNYLTLTRIDELNAIAQQEMMNRQNTKEVEEVVEGE